MGYDLYMRRQQEAEEAGVEPRFHLTIGGMTLALNLMEQKGAVDWEAPMPPDPPATYPEEDYLRRFEAIQQRFHAEEEARVERRERDGEPVVVPGLKLGGTNDRWWVFPAECRVVASAARSITEAEIKEAILSDEEEVKSVEFEAQRIREKPDGTIEVLMEPDLDAEPDFDRAAATFKGVLDGFADYCERAAEYNGFRVY